MDINIVFNMERIEYELKMIPVRFQAVFHGNPRLIPLQFLFTEYLIVNSIRLSHTTV